MSKDASETLAASSLSHDVEVRHGDVLPPSDPITPGLPLAPAPIAPKRKLVAWRP